MSPWTLPDQVSRVWFLTGLHLQLWHACAVRWSVIALQLGVVQRTTCVELEIHPFLVAFLPMHWCRVVGIIVWLFF